MKSTKVALHSPILTHMHPGNPHGLRFNDGDAGDKGGGGSGGGSQGGDGGAGADAGDKAGKGDDGGQGSQGDLGFPKDTPVAQMTVEQQAAYWKHHARKHEDTAKARADYDQLKRERDELRARHQTAEEKAIEEAKASAKAEERAAWAPRLVQTELRGALRARGLDDEQVTAIVGPLDHKHFLTDTGEVDADKVSQYVAGFGQGEKKWPDMGQGKRGSGTSASKADAGRAEAERRGYTKTT